MNILLLTSHLKIGGIPVYTVSLARGLAKRGWKVWVASSGGESLEELKEAGIQHLKLNLKTKSILSPKIPVALLKLSAFVKRENIHLIHAQTRVTQVIANLIKITKAIPYVTTCHGFFKPKLARRKWGCWGDRVIAISEAVREHLVNDMKVKKEKIIVVYDGIDCERFKPVTTKQKQTLKAEIGLGKGPVVGIIARLSPVKGHEVLFRAMQGVVKEINGCQLFVVGDGPYKNELVRLKDKLRIGGITRFVPARLDTPRLLGVMDVFILPSIQEGLGLALLEALAQGLPCVASDVGGIYEIIKDGQTGLLVPPQDWAGLQKAILKLLRDRQLSDKLGQSGRKFIREKFSISGMIDKVEKVYKEVLSL